MSKFEMPQPANQNNERKYSIDRIPTVSEISQDISEAMVKQRKESDQNSESVALREEIKKKEGELLELKQRLAESDRKEGGVKYP